MNRPFTNLLVALSIGIASLGPLSSVQASAISTDANSSDSVTFRSIRPLFEARAPTEHSRISADVWHERFPNGKKSPTAFDLDIDVVGSGISDIILVTMIDFAVAPVQGHQASDSLAIARDVSWGQITDMQDSKTTTVQLRRGGESQRVTIQGYDLAPAIRACAGGNTDLWPWAMKIRILAFNRQFKQVGAAETIVQLIPSAERLRSTSDAVLPN